MNSHIQLGKYLPEVHAYEGRPAATVNANKSVNHSLECRRRHQITIISFSPLDPPSDRVVAFLFYDSLSGFNAST